MKFIVITAGHSNTDPGAVYGGHTEADIVTDFRNMVAHYLRESGIHFATDGVGKENLPLNQAINLAKSGDIAVEFHCNAFTKPTATGTEALSGPKDADLSARLSKAVAGALGIVDRGYKTEGSGQHSRLGFVQAGGIILELFFLSNPSDLELYLARKWLAAKSVAEILIEVSSANPAKV